MSRLACFSLVAASLLLSGLAVAQLGEHLRPQLGKPAPSGFESVVMRDGSGLPKGGGTVQQGQALYNTHCVACHGLLGQQAGNALVGGQGTLSTDRPFRTVGSYWPYATTLFDYINRAMPYGQEKSLTADEVYAVTTYVLYLNDIINKDAQLDQENLATVRMPNATGFSSAENW